MDGAMQLTTSYPMIYWGLWTRNKWVAELPDGNRYAFPMTPGGWKLRTPYGGDTEDLYPVSADIAPLACKVAGVPSMARMISEQGASRQTGQPAQLACQEAKVSVG